MSHPTRFAARHGARCSAKVIMTERPPHLVAAGAKALLIKTIYGIAAARAGGVARIYAQRTSSQPGPLQATSAVGSWLPVDAVASARAARMLPAWPAAPPSPRGPIGGQAGRGRTDPARPRSGRSGPRGAPGGGGLRLAWSGNSGIWNGSAIVGSRGGRD
jgi:hypothetical protein